VNRPLDRHALFAHHIELAGRCIGKLATRPSLGHTAMHLPPVNHWMVLKQPHGVFQMGSEDIDLGIRAGVRIQAIELKAGKDASVFVDHQRLIDGHHPWHQFAKRTVLLDLALALVLKGISRPLTPQVIYGCRLHRIYSLRP